MTSSTRSAQPGALREVEALGESRTTAATQIWFTIFVSWRRGRAHQRDRARIGREHARRARTPARRRRP
jgi:hypothetical protein